MKKFWFQSILITVFVFFMMYGANQLTSIPTGEGMALVFFSEPTAPVECALEVGKALKNHPELELRMGVHSGPVNEIIDVNGRINVAGSGINMAQRVMDSGDAGAYEFADFRYRRADGFGYS